MNTFHICLGKNFLESWMKQTNMVTERKLATKKGLILQEALDFKNDDMLTKKTGFYGNCNKYGCNK